MHSLRVLHVSQVEAVDRQDGVSDVKVLGAVGRLTDVNLWYQNGNTVLLASLEHTYAEDKYFLKIIHRSFRPLQLIDSDETPSNSSTVSLVTVIDTSISSSSTVYS